jgi:hypothetical protein
VATVPGRPGASSTVDVHSELETESVHGVAGVNLHFFDRLFGRFMVAFDDCSVGVQTKRVYTTPLLAPAGGHAISAGPQGAKPVRSGRPPAIKTPRRTRGGG